MSKDSPVSAEEDISDFFKRPILNSPYDYPSRHWELDESGQPTQRVVDQRRRAQFVTAVPKPKKSKAGAKQRELALGEADGLSTEAQRYDPTPIINELRRRVDVWRELKNPDHWGVTPETRRLLQHWRHHSFSGIRPFFCQIEAIETVIWLTEVAPNERPGKAFLEHLDNSNNDANPELPRLGLKLATGAGKTTVMAMLIAWQTVNAIRRPNSPRFTRGFLVMTPGLTIRDRLRVLQPNDPDSYFHSRELVPNDMLGDIARAKIVITNYHAFKRRERLELSKGGRSLLQGRGAELDTQETEGQMLQRVMPDLMGMKSILVFNDEGHHCDIEILSAEDGQIKVKVKGVDVFHPSTGEVRSDGAEGIACWLVDTDYNEESFFVRHAYFLGANDPYSALKTTLKAEINEEAWATLRSDTSRSFPRPKSGRIAVKVINHLGDEVMKVFRV